MNIQRMLERGNGACRQRCAASEGGVAAAVRLLVEETTLVRPRGLGTRLDGGGPLLSKAG